ncbi:hypothetical protein TNCV_25941 [Trichonephila clavipes]|uniref:Uncharacterized protein n=1 Tax=Trichonephila clavipes TaxID=2585209 RepID=A0A8X6W1L4_TRICX|nr:hypothetical protein TNCV_25941 [Trichonephila clavipes]
MSKLKHSPVGVRRREQFKCSPRHLTMVLDYENISLVMEEAKQNVSFRVYQAECSLHSLGWVGPFLLLEFHSRLGSLVDPCFSHGYRYDTPRAVGIISSSMRPEFVGTKD